MVHLLAMNKDTRKFMKYMTVEERCRSGKAFALQG